MYYYNCFSSIACFEGVFPKEKKIHLKLQTAFVEISLKHKCYEIDAEFLFSEDELNYLKNIWKKKFPDKEIQQRRKTPKQEIHEILMKACTDDDAITEPPQEVLSKHIFIYSAAPAHSDIAISGASIETIITETINNRLMFGHPEQISKYLQTIKNINPYHAGNISFRSFRFFDGIDTDFQLQVMEKIMKDCSPELIAAIFIETHFRLLLSLNQWLKETKKYGKFDAFMHCLKDFEVFAKEEKQNILLEKYSVDGMSYENKLPEEANYRIIGCDTETDTVLLTKIINKSE